MVIYHPQTTQEAVRLREENVDSVYLAGGTDDLRLNGGTDRETALIDINPLIGSGIADIGDGVIKIEAGTTFQDMIDSPLVPDAVKKACFFNASFVKRNASTVGGNIALGRDDSYLLALFTALGVTLSTTDGDMPVEEYGESKSKAVILSLLLDTKKKAWVKRFALSSTTHASLIAATSGERYALSVKGSALVWGDSPDIWKKAVYVSDITGSAEYKKYLAQTVFTLRRD